MSTSIEIKNYKAGNMLAFVTLNYEGIIIKGIKIMDGAKGPWVAMPSEKGKDGKYHNTVFFSREIKDRMEEEILNKFFEADEKKPYSEEPAW
jgi:DNA-binding cell septation regulator SpoVG